MHHQWAVDSDLYPDLGYGTVTLSLIDMGIRNYYLSVKTERHTEGTNRQIKPLRKPAKRVCSAAHGVCETGWWVSAIEA